MAIESPTLRSYHQPAVNFFQTNEWSIFVLKRYFNKNKKISASIRLVEKIGDKNFTKFWNLFQIHCNSVTGPIILTIWSWSLLFPLFVCFNPDQMIKQVPKHFSEFLKTKFLAKVSLSLTHAFCIFMIIYMLF